VSVSTVGIVIAAYNASSYLSEAVGGIKEQTLSDWVCVLVDDGSTDETFELAQALTNDDKRFTVVTKPNGGTANARNFGLALLPPTKYVTFHDHDDRYHPDALTLLVQEAETASASNCAGAHGLPRRIDAFGDLREDDSWWNKRTRSIKVARFGKMQDTCGPTRFQTLITQCTIYPPSLVITRRSIADQLGGFDPDMKIFEDWDWMIRASRYGNFVFMPVVIVDYRIHGKNISTASPEQDSVFFEAVRIKTARSSQNTSTQKRELSATWRAIECGHVRDLSAATWRAARTRRPRTAVKAGARTALAMARCAAGRPTFLDADRLP
jgi:glycosyltransferase involved in cell wall biosynthesis